MDQARDIHNYPQRYEFQLRRLKNSSISARNKKLIIDFDNFCLIEGLTLPRRIKLMNSMVLVGELYLKRDLEKVTIDDLKKAVLQIEKRVDYSLWTRRDYKAIIKKFFKWLEYGDDYRQHKEYPKRVSWIYSNLKFREQPKVRVSDLLTEEEVQKLIEVAEHPRDRAFISMLYELGARIGELGNLSIKNIHKDKWSYLIDLTGKTGQRTPRIVMSSPYLTAWLNSHPLKDDRDAPLWVKQGIRDKTEPMTYGSLREIVARLAERAGIKRRIYPHLFRHTRVTHLLMKKQINEAQAKVYFGWVPSSTMLSEYSHLVSNDVNDAILNLYGIKTDDNTPAKLVPQQCPVCKSTNSHDAKFCQNCSSVMDMKTAIAVEERIQARDTAIGKLVADKDVLEFLVRKAKEKGLVEELIKSL